MNNDLFGQEQQNFSNDFGANMNNIASPNSTIHQAQLALNNEQQQAPQTAQPAGNQPNFIERMLPTAGGILGGLGGEALDVFGGGVAGAGIGSALGKALEDKLTGQNIGGDVLASGAEGAIGQGVGKGAGMLLGKAGGMLGDLAGNIEGKAAANAADQVYGAIRKGLRQAHDLTGSLKLAQELGLDHTDPQSLIDTGKNANELLTNSVNDALGMAGPVDASGYNQMVRDAIGARAGVLGGLDPVVLSKGRLGPPNTAAAKLLQQLENYGAGKALPNADPTAIRELLQQVGKAYGDAEPSVTAMTGAKDPVQVATHDALGEVYNNLKSLLFNRPGVAENFSKLEGNILPEDVGGNEQLANKLNEVLGNAQDHQPVLDAMQQFGNLRNVGHDALTASKGLVSKAPAQGQLGGILGGAVDLGGLADATIGHNPLGIVAPLVYHGAQNPAMVGGAGSILGKIGASTLPGIAGQVIANSPNDVAGPASTNTNVELQPMNDQNSILNELMRVQIDNAIMGNGTGGLSDAVGQMQKANQAQAALQDLSRNYNMAGGGQGLVGGLLNELGGKLTGGEAGNYGNQAQADAQAIAAATGQPVQAVEKSVPSLTENQTAAQASLGNLQSLIQALLNPSTSGVISQVRQ